MQQIDWYTEARQLSADTLTGLRSVLVVAPHQDDESLGCGGTIALLTQAGIPVHVVFVSDGSMSHPNSKKYPASRLIALREAEAAAALKILGVGPADFTFLRLPDSRVPAAGTTGFENAIDLIGGMISFFKPRCVLVPWRRDPHRDHRAAWEITDAAIGKAGVPVRRLEYFVWLWERASDDDLPRHGEMKVWQVDIKNTLTLKRQAVAAHLSQTTYLIDDDPGGFILSASVLSHFEKPVEIFAES